MGKYKNQPHKPKDGAAANAPKPNAIAKAEKPVHKKKVVARVGADKEFWEGDHADNYNKVELLMFQGGFSSFVMAGANKPSVKVLEVGCGSGVGSEIAAQSILSKDSVLVICDFSEKQLQMANKRFVKSDFCQIKGNKAVINVQTDYTGHGPNDKKINLDALVSKHQNRKDASKSGFNNAQKLVYGCRASGTNLPFKKNWFNCYVSNLLLHLIDDPIRQIEEAFRVLKPKGIACFTVAGRRSETLLINAEDLADKKLGNTPNQRLNRGTYEVSENMDEKFIPEFKKAGFAQVKRWYQTVNYPVRNGEDFLKIPLHKTLESADEEKKTMIKSTFDELSGADTLDLRVFEVMIILAYKD